jgi:hypothetical protein
MEQLLAWDGPWSPDLINLMAIVAEEAEKDESSRLFRAVQAAAGSLFSEKVGASFVRAMKSGAADIRDAQRRARGLTPKLRNVGDEMLAILRKIEVMSTKGGRRGR